MIYFAHSFPRRSSLPDIATLLFIIRIAPGVQYGAAFFACRLRARDEDRRRGPRAGSEVSRQL